MDNSRSLQGSILLVAGCSIGAGMLGLPVLSAPSGFFPSLFMLFIAWIYMCTTGLFLLEVNLWFKDEVSLISMADKILGKGGKWLSLVLYLLLFYSVLVAYETASGELIFDFLEDVFSFTGKKWYGSLFFTLFLGGFVYLGTFFVDELNRFFMVGLVLTYGVLLFFGLPKVQGKFLECANFPLSLYALPSMIFMYGFHNLVPSLTTYLKHDVKKLTKAFIIGSFIPFIVYCLWNYLILGLVPLNIQGGIEQEFLEGELATHVLKIALKKSWVVQVAEYFAFFAIITSFLSVALSFVDFLADGFREKKVQISRLFLCFLTFFPPFFFSLYYPKFFLQALDYAGLITIILFGILPALMVFLGRYFFKIEGVQIVPGGKATLFLITGFSLSIFIYLVYEKFNFFTS